MSSKVPSGLSITNPSGRTLNSLGPRLSALLARLNSRTDPVANQVVLKRLSTYASIITSKPVECEWGDSFYTKDQKTIVLNPFFPKNAPAVERKIIIDARLEHEIRGHWQYTPLGVVERVKKFAEGVVQEAQTGVWSAPEWARRRHAVQALFNILEDGRVETRLRWEQPLAYETIAAGDLVYPRWPIAEDYLPAHKAYSKANKAQAKHSDSGCGTCGKDDAPTGECISCFTERYRWEQITGILLLAAIPPHATPLSVVEPEVQDAYQACAPWILHALRGTAQHTFETAVKIAGVLIDRKMVPPRPDTSHLSVTNASGQPYTGKDGPMSQKTAQSSGFGPSSGGGDPEGEGDHQSSPSGTEETPQQKPSPGRDKQSSTTATEPQGNSSTTPSADKRNRESDAAQTMAMIAEQDLQNFDFAVDLDLERIRQNVQLELGSATLEYQLGSARDLIMAANGMGAGPGIDVRLKRTQPSKDTYRVLRERNLEAGKRFAHEIRDLLSLVNYPQRFQKHGRLDRSQLVNAVARGRDSVFIRTREKYELDMAVSIVLDVSGSMDSFNQTLSRLSRGSGQSEPAQLGDAVTTCVIGLQQLGATFDVRAFGSYQWLAKGFHEQNCDGVGGVVGLDGGGTDMVPAIEYARIALLGRSESSQMMVVLTDGWPSNSDQAAGEVRLARRQGIRVLGVQFTNQREDRGLFDPQMASIFGAEGYTRIRSLEQFPSVVGRAIKEIFTRPAGLK